MMSHLWSPARCPGMARSMTVAMIQVQGQTVGEDEDDASRMSEGADPSRLRRDSYSATGSRGLGQDHEEPRDQGQRHDNCEPCRHTVAPSTPRFFEERLNLEFRCGVGPNRGAGHLATWQRMTIELLSTSTMSAVNIDREEPIALHDQVAAEIRRAISEGEAGPGERLPLTKDLAAVLA